MKIAILGGGFSGLTAAFYLRKKGHGVTIFEKEPVLGGLARGFKSEGWQWYLERTYHHLFSNDSDILKFAEDTGFKDIFFQSPETASLYEISSAGPAACQPQNLPTSRYSSGRGPILGAPRLVPPAENYKPRTPNHELRTPNNFRIFPVDTPQDFLKFPLLSLPVKIRAAFVLAFLKFSPFFSYYEKQTAKEFLSKFMGEKAWNVLWQELFRKKFGKYAENILASFIWARVSKRTKNLGYVKGGFQTFIDYIARLVEEKGTIIKEGSQIVKIEKSRDGFVILVSGAHPESGSSMTFDAVISTLPTPVLVKLTNDVFPSIYLNQLKKIEYLHAINLVLETSKTIFDKTYWVSVCTEELPMMVVVQQTNFIDKKYYGGNHIAYVGNYIDNNDPLIKMTDKEIFDFYLPHLNKISHDSQLKTHDYFVFKAPFAQPIFDKEFLKNRPHFETPVKNFFIANLDMTYPYDRGTNYAVKVGKDVSQYL